MSRNGGLKIRYNHGGSVMTRISLLAVAGCCYTYGFSTLPHQHYHHDSHKNSCSLLESLLPTHVNHLENPQFMGALGVQLLLFGGWRKNQTEWQRDYEIQLSLRDRLDRITPTYKPGGQLNYDFIEDMSGSTTNANDMSLFQESLSLLAGKRNVTTISQLVHILEDIGLSATDFDEPAQRVLKAMLSWKIPPLPRQSDERKTHIDEELTLLIFSFDATASCYSVHDCPLPGPTNELLAATAARFREKLLQRSQSTVRIIAQWEVAAALRKSYGLSDADVIPIGTPGTFQNTAEIFQLMLCELSQQTQQPSEAMILAHPDHLRRVLWTAETILKQHPKAAQNCGFDSSLPNQTLPRLVTALQPYRLDWPFTKTARPTTRHHSINLFDAVSTMVHSNGHELETHWYDVNHLGYFPDGDPQKWTRRRAVYLLYDQWAVAKGIVTGTIDADLALSLAGETTTTTCTTESLS